MKYTLIRSSRKTLALQIKRGEVIVRAPLFTSLAEIERFVESHVQWIEKHMPKNTDTVVPLSKEAINDLIKKAKEYIPQRVKLYADLLGVGYSRITIRNQRTRWGSCSAKGNLNFNCLLMLAPLEVIDSVVVHEVCHLKEMNHSKRFYAHVLSIYPEYYKHHAWLKKNGELLMKRMEEL